MDDTQCQKMSNLSLQNQQEVSLLEKLRDMPRIPECPKQSPSAKAKAAKQKMLLMINHRSEFPFHLQIFLVEAELRWSKCPEIFVSEVYKCAKALFMGQSIFKQETDAEKSDSMVACLNEWHGLDSEIDTEDQVEVVLRLFPSLLEEPVLVEMPRDDPSRSRTGNIMNALDPSHVFLLRAKTIFFVPLFLKMRKEVDGNVNLGIYYFCKLLLVPGQKTFRDLFGKQYATLAFFGQEEAASDDDEELNDQSLLALKRMKEMELLQSDEDIDNLIKWVLAKSKNRSIDFAESRLRLLIEWKPSVLKEFRREFPDPLLHVFWGYCGNPIQKCSSLEMRLFEVIYELGMTHFPEELGFAFPEGVYDEFCKRYGAERITGILYNKLKPASKSSGQTKKTLPSLVISAATNEEICLDAVYTLLRFDPVAVIPESPGNQPSEK